MQNSLYDWKYFSERSELSGLGLNSGVYWPRGKLLGGCSAINAMLYVRGVDRDFNEWRDFGNLLWGWDDVLPFFKKSEKNVDHQNSRTKDYHGFDGPLNIENYQSSEIDREMKNAIAGCFAELGFKKIDDINSDEHIGYTYAQGTLKNGRRYSSAKAFLNSEITGKRPNLHVIKHAHATRININEKTKELESIDFIQTQQNVEMNAKVKREAIISAGAVNTPQLLMLSGLGPEEQLKKFNIKVIENLEGVGKNLQDHSITPFVVSFHKSTPIIFTPTHIINEYFNFLTKREGMFTNLGSSDLMTFMSTIGDKKYPDIQFLNFMFTKGSTPTLIHILSNFNYKKEIIDSIAAKNDDSDVLLILTVLLKPKSIGSIELKSSNPFEAPQIKPNYLKEPEDVHTIMRAIKTLQKMTTTKTFNQHEGEVIPINLSDCAKNLLNSDDYLECYVRHMTITLYHPVGTAKMGSADDKVSVVDETLKVKGIKGLRVADASVMPTIVAGNTNAAVIMIGERAADFIKQDNQFNLKEEL